VWGAVTILAVGAVALLATKDRRREPPASLQYDIAEHEQVDPALVVFEETGTMTPDAGDVRALAATGDERIYVAGTGAVVVYDLEGAELARHALSAPPICMAVTPDGEILLGMPDHVEVLNADGTPKAQWGSLGERARITSIVADDSDVFVADAGNRLLMRYDREGNVLGRIGERNPEQDIPGFIIPSPFFDVAFDNMGALWAVNPGRHGLESYRPDGGIITSWYRPSLDIDGFCGCCNPAHVAFRGDGSLVTAEKGLARVKLYSVDRRLLGFVAAPEAFLDRPTGAFASELESPLQDVAVDARDRVLVLDSRRNAVRVFQQKEPA
jgi:hypothetical protein